MILLVVLVAALAVEPGTAAARSSVDAAPPAEATADLATALAPDGTFRGAQGVDGPVDPQAWTLVSDLATGEAPRFSPAGEAVTAAIGPWVALGSNGAGNGALNSGVYALAVSGSSLYVGGSSLNIGGIATADYVAKWNGSTWSALGSNGAGNGALNNTVSSLAVSGGALYVGGNFTNAAGIATADDLARWDGSAWSALGSDGAGNGALNGTVTSMVVAGSDLIAGGYFRNAAGVPEADGVARWNGAAWSALGSNGAGDGAIGEGFPVVETLAVGGGNLYMGGAFHDLAGIPEADDVAMWDGADWSALGSDGAGDGAILGIVDALAVSAGDLFVGGDFSDAAGIAEADAIAKWNGAAWSALGSNGAGDGALSGNYVNTLAVSGTNLYVGGAFFDAAGVAAADQVAEWNGIAWSAVGSNGAGDGAFNDQVFAIAVAGVTLYAGGWFTNAAGSATADFAAGWSLGDPGVPSAPSKVTAIGRNGAAQVLWTAPASDGGSPITGYTVTSSPGGFTCTTAANACWVMGLTNGVAYTFTVTATNLAGTGPASAASIAATPVAGTGPTVLAISAGAYETCALLAGGTVACWGLNGHVELGLNPTTISPSPSAVDGLAGATAIAAGDTHACAVIAGGAVACWGANDFGQLGDGTTTGSGAPVTVSGVTGATAVTAGWADSCALLAGGTIKCWGRNTWGELGDGSTTDRHLAVSVSGVTGATAIDAGSTHTCAVIAAGNVKCWGENEFGEIGDGSTTDRHLPVSVTGLTGATTVGLGAAHTCARLSAGGVRCWGDNGLGALGDGTMVERHTPATVAGVTTAAIAATGTWHSCAVLTGGGAKCWGDNYFGQLGNGASLDVSPSAVTVTGLVDATAITGGVIHTCALRTGGVVSCWGSNDFGSLGTGNLTSHLTPFPVAWPVPGTPGAPVQPRATAASTSAVVSWSAPVDDGGSAITGYTVRSAPGGKTCSPTPATATTCTVTGLTNNIEYRFIVTATNANGIGQAAVTDFVAPTTGTLSLAITKRSIGAPAGSTIPVTVSWATGLDNFGVTWYELDRRATGGAWTPIVLPTSTPMSVTVGEVPGTVYTYRVRAVLYDGAVGGWVTSASLRALARQDGASTVPFGGTGWVRTTAGSPYGGSLRYTSSTGRTAKTTFTGRGIAWVTTRGKNRGKAEVWLDGSRVATISLYASSTAVRQIIWSRSFSTTASHTVVVKVLGTHSAGATGNRVDVDAFIVLTP